MRRDLLISLALAVFTACVYWPVRNCDFIFYDDPQFITENSQIQAGLTWDTIAYAFTRPVVGNWHPITTLSHAMDCEFFGVNAGAHHLVNVLIHSINAAFLFLLLQQMLIRDRPAFFFVKATGNPSGTGASQHSQGTFVCALTALLFALHPLRVESVAWIAERKDVLSGFFFLLSLWMYVVYGQKSKNRETETMGHWRRPWVYYMASLLSFALGLMSKPMLVTVPVLLFLLDYWPLKRLGISNLKSPIANARTLLIEKVPFLTLALVDCVITLAVQKAAGAMQIIQGITWSERLGNAVVSYLRYLGKLVWPSHLAIVYPHPAKHYYLNDQWPDWQIASAGLLLVLVSISCLLQARRRPYLAFGWFWFLITLIPVIGLVQAGEQAMADRYTYLALVGPVLSLILSASEAVKPVAAFQSTAFMALIAGLFVVILVFLTRRQLNYWQNTVALFDHAVLVTPDNPSAQFALGVGLEHQDHLGQAMVHYRVAAAIDPHYSKAYYNLGQLLRKGEHWAEAADAYSKAARMNPADLATQLNLASVLRRAGRAGEAAIHFEQALRMDPNSLEGLNNLAWLLATSPDSSVRNGARAVELAERARALTGSKAPFVLGTLAAAYAEAGRFDDAVLTGEQALVLATGSGDLNLVKRNQELLTFYRAKKPYRE